MDANLDTLKRDILDALQHEGFAVFQGGPHAPDQGSPVFWDTERSADFRAFIAVAKRLEMKLVVFWEREFRAGEVGEQLEMLEDCELTADERRQLERSARDFRVYEGRTCALSMSFHYENRDYVFEAHTEWFDEYLDWTEEVSSHLPDDEDEEEGSLGGYYSNN